MVDILSNEVIHSHQITILDNLRPHFNLSLEESKGASYFMRKSDFYFP